MAALSAREEAQLLAWRADEEARWRERLKAREADILACSSREWRALEAKRADALTKQKRIISAIESELKRRLHEMERRQSELRQAEEELASRREAYELHAQRQAGQLQVEGEREAAQLRAELTAAQTKLAVSEGRASFFTERLKAVEAQEARQEEQAAQSREAQTIASAQAISLRAEAEELKGSIERHRRECSEASSTAEERKHQALSARRHLAQFKSSTLAKEQARMRQLLRQQQQQQLAAQQQLRSPPAAQFEARTQVQPPPRQAETFAGPPAGAVRSTGAEVERLRLTRDGLLKSGVYGEDDRVPVMLAEKISRLTRSALTGT
uniref:Uncharacterized protein n=1 Tax=Coccolithus braarudii TaxID=221442 RepID=A0A7S0LJZ3_9EUKA|mmetsp:Transcript_44683/g.95015  ORF Transcript_44683/g.95015 Transcript_44683/m.95015 type:complete len:326 (+) Transcript_44683:22-999(+)|eukprot:CAMPEP_0183339394 /NCGR_PEP_ID=MMETSP0164_2-20130417/6332_1 /TAXON_ID=221442 /ORGANISM="Coccolithus pelagicus ssp braarudi, Strain PLY182g" /LENGTH=325 /DNA_ID=CAMNT_0025509375 /DNA_START=19 /DNA_END=996 /DNA_ORIENTATION=-